MLENMSAPMTADNVAESDNIPSSPSSFWCHECDGCVDAHVSNETLEICCQSCGSNFVEEVDQVSYTI